MMRPICTCLPSTLNFFFFNDTATTEIYTLSLHDALPISEIRAALGGLGALSQHLRDVARIRCFDLAELRGDRKSTRLNSSHQIISYAVFCLKKKKHIFLHILLLHRAPKNTSLISLRLNPL